jgi:hypothetical protein
MCQFGLMVFEDELERARAYSPRSVRAVMNCSLVNPSALSCSSSISSFSVMRLRRKRKGRVGVDQDDCTIH